MFQRVTCASNEDIMLIKEMLVDRFKKNPKELEPEASFIYQLKNVLDDYCQGKEKSIKIVMLREFANDLDEILNLYDEKEYKQETSEEDIISRLDNIEEE